MINDSPTKVVDDLIWGIDYKQIRELALPNKHTEFLVRWEW